MPRPRFQNLDPTRRRALLDAAGDQLAEKGYELASVNAILDAAGFSKGSFYYYFDDKADLAAEVLLEAYRPLLRIIEAEPPTSIESFWATVHSLQRKGLDAMEASPRTFQLISRTGHAVLTEPALAERLLPMMTESRQKVRALWLQGQQLGAVRDDLSVDALVAMVEAVKRAAWQATFPPAHTPTVAEVEAFSRHVLDLAQRLTAPRPASAPALEVS